MMDSVIPMELWNEYGITSYNLALSDSRIPTNYWVLKNALRYTTPKVVVLETAYLVDDKTTFISSHSFFDSLPIDSFKLEAARDLFDDDFHSILDVMVPAIRYHNRWNKLSKEDFVHSNDYLFGYGPFYQVQVKSLPEQIIENPTPVESVATDYIYKIIELCRENDIELMFTSFPFLALPSSQNDLSYCGVIAKENNLNYLSPDIILNSIDPLTDFFDHYEDTSHANYSGAFKNTRILGDYLQKHYDLPDHRDDNNYSNWNQYYESFYAYKKNAFPVSSDLPSYLTKCYDKDFLYLIEINNPIITKSEFYVNLLNNIGSDVSLMNSDMPSFYLIKNHETVGFQTDYLKHEDYSLDSEIGYITFVCKEDENLYQILLDNQVIYSASYSDTYQADIRVTVIEKANHQFVDSVFWNIEGDVSVGNGKRK